jgi:UDP-N-acetylmuramate: L-alanyl-gamma-D-glutamyl-meso-diaminopimelate ligase
VVKKVFLCGIAGTGMSALAGLFKQRGYKVSGSDSRFYPPVDRLLKDLDITLFQGFSEKNIPHDVDLCVIGNAVSRGNPEAEYILNQHLEYLSMAEALQRFFIKGKQSLVVAGSHGKTTTASFIAHVLACAGLRPGFFIGGKPCNFAANYQVGAGEHFVSEGDEYETAFFDRSAKFFKYRPDYLLITALEHDHLDFYSSAESYLRSFQNLVNQVPGQGRIIYNGDYEMARQAVSRPFTPLISYGRPPADCEISAIHPSRGGYDFFLKRAGVSRQYHTSLSGPYNVWNLTAGILLADEMNLPEAVVRQAVATFQGVERRLSVLGQVQNTLFIEDFAHHPTAIAQVLKGLPDSYPGRKIVVIFEPRSWSLRRNFFQDLLPTSLAYADEIVIKDVYDKEKIPATERLGIGKLKADLEARGKKVHVCEDFEEIKRFVAAMDFARSQVLILLSNGDVGDFTAWVRGLCSKTGKT